MTKMEIRSNKQRIVALGKLAPIQQRPVFAHMARTPIFTHQVYTDIQYKKHAVFIARILKTVV